MTPKDEKITCDWCGGNHSHEDCWKHLKPSNEAGYVQPPKPEITSVELLVNEKVSKYYIELVTKIHGLEKDIAKLKKRIAGLEKLV